MAAGSIDNPSSAAADTDAATPTTAIQHQIERLDRLADRAEARHERIERREARLADLRAEHWVRRADGGDELTLPQAIVAVGVLGHDHNWWSGDWGDWGHGWDWGW